MLTYSIFVYLLIISVTGAFKVMNLYEGDVCNQVRGVQWTCKMIKECPKTLKDIKNGVKPDICNFKGSDVIACCEPDAATPSVKPTTAQPENKSGVRPTVGPAVIRPPTGFKSKQISGPLNLIGTYRVHDALLNAKCNNKPLGVTYNTDCMTWQTSQWNTARGEMFLVCMKYGKSVFVEIVDPLGEGTQTFDTCAAVEPLIVNGVDADSREYPHMALVGYGEKDAIEWLCAGSLISERFILSAAHCSNAGRRGFARWVRLGDYNIGTDKDERLGLAQAVDYEIIEVINHPSYTSSSLYNDIALFRLGHDVEFNEYIRPICLQTEHNIPKPYLIGSGWGATKYRGDVSDILQKVNLTVTPAKICNDAYTRIPLRKLKNGIVDDIMFCAGDILNRKDTCQGDSGGPLQLRLNNPYCMYNQVGITSFGYKCASTTPGVYTRVSAFVPWIESVVWP